MPELPEVEVVRQGLVEHVLHQTLTHVDIRGTRVARRHVHGPAHMANLLTGRRIAAVDRRGKYLWLVLVGDSDVVPGGGEDRFMGGETTDATQAGHNDSFALIIHLGMSGQLLVQPCGKTPVRHTHAVFTLADAPAGPPVRELWFVDQRTFGGLAVGELTQAVPGHPHGIPDSVVHIAPDPLEEAFDIDAVAARMKSSASGIKRLLLNQSVVSGIGNIYADEALWRAQIHGERSASTLTRPVITRLLAHTQEVMRDSLIQGGTSFDALYVDVDGNSGYFARSLDAYGRSGQPCRRCGRPMKREQFMNRSSTFCPGCQRRPRYARTS